MAAAMAFPLMALGALDATRGRPKQLTDAAVRGATEPLTRQMLGAASSTAAEGDMAMTERRYTEAAELFGQAANYVPKDRLRSKVGESLGSHELESGRLGGLGAGGWVDRSNLRGLRNCLLANAESGPTAGEVSGQTLSLVHEPMFTWPNLGHFCSALRVQR
jgi:hypothetical protein